MVYNTRNYWVFGLCPSSGILKTIEQNVSETHKEDQYELTYYSWVPIRKVQF
jgi:hypothetical protein